MSKKRNFMRLATAGTVVLAGVVASALTGHVGVAMSAPAGNVQNVAPVAALGSLSAFAGTWNCSSVVTGPDGSSSEFDTTPTAQFILDGNYMRWQEVNSIGGTPIASAEYIWGWDAERQVFTLDGYGSFGQRTVQKSTGWEGDSITMKGRTSQPDGSSNRTTIKFTKTGVGTFTVRAVVRLGEQMKIVSVTSCGGS